MLNYLNSIDDQLALTAGTLGVSAAVDRGIAERWAAMPLLGALELQHYLGQPLGQSGRSAPAQRRAALQRSAAITTAIR